jgi:hypothetical protein
MMTMTMMMMRRMRHDHKGRAIGGISGEERGKGKGTGYWG